MFLHSNYITESDSAPLPVSVQGEHRGAVRELVEPGEAVRQSQSAAPPAVQLGAEDADEGAGARGLRPHGL